MLRGRVQQCGRQGTAAGLTVLTALTSTNSPPPAHTRKRPPDAIGKVIGLGARAVPPAADLALLDEQTRERYRQQCPGWRVVTSGATACIQQEWTVKDAGAAAELVAAIQKLCAEAGHAPAAVEAVGGATVVARLATAALGGLSEADFIVAARVNAMDIAHLLPKKKARFWA